MQIDVTLAHEFCIHALTTDSINKVSIPLHIERPQKKSHSSARHSSARPGNIM